MHFKRFAVALLLSAAVFTAASVARAGIHVTFRFASGTSLQATATRVSTNAPTTHVEIAAWPAFTPQLLEALTSGQTVTGTVEFTSGDGLGQTLTSTTRLSGAQISAVALSFAVSGKNVTLVETIDMSTPKWESVASPPGTAWVSAASAVQPPALDSGVVTLGTVKSAPFSANMSFTATTTLVNGVATRKVVPSALTFTEAAAGPASMALQMLRNDGRLITPFAFDVFAGTTDVYRIVLSGARITALAAQTANNVSTETVSVSAGTPPVDGDVRAGAMWGFSILSPVP